MAALKFFQWHFVVVDDFANVVMTTVNSFPGVQMQKLMIVLVIMLGSFTALADCGFGGEQKSVYYFRCSSPGWKVNLGYACRKVFVEVAQSPFSRFVGRHPVLNGRVDMDGSAFTALFRPEPQPESLHTMVFTGRQNADQSLSTALYWNGANNYLAKMRCAPAGAALR